MDLMTTARQPGGWRAVESGESLFDQPCAASNRFATSDHFTTFHQAVM
jgi:hypothetical protein